MNDILTDFSKPALINAIKANLFELFRFMGRSSSMEFYEDPRMSWLISGIPSPFLNAVFQTQLAAEDADETITDMVERFKSRGMPLGWFVEPDVTPPDMESRLKDRGFIYSEGPPGMATDLLTLDESLTLPPGLTIQRVADLEMLKQWSRAVAEGFGLPDSIRDIFYETSADVGLDEDSPWKLYVGLIDGEVVASTSVLLKAGVSGIYNVATVPGARGRGIGRALTLAPLLESRSMGYRIGILHSSPMGFNIYRSLGFEEYCSVGHYEWQGQNT